MFEKDHKIREIWMETCCAQELNKFRNQVKCPEITFALSTSIDCFYNKNILQLKKNCLHVITP